MSYNYFESGKAIVLELISRVCHFPQALWHGYVLNYRKNPLKETEQGVILNHMDITNEWTKKRKKGSVIEKLSYIVGGNDYIVDGKHVILKPSEKERAVAAILSEQYGKQVELVPQVVYPQGIQTPDYLIDGDRFDLKSPTARK